MPVSTPKTTNNLAQKVVSSVRDYVRNVAPTPAALRAVQEDAKRNGTSKLGIAEIDGEIAARKQQASRKKPKQPGR
jgi:hypothetical protein